MDRNQLKQFILDTTYEAGELALSMFGNHGNVEVKSHPLDMVSDADKDTNKFFIERINQTFPDHGIVSEESPAEGIDNEVVWFIDPIDGTLNYITGIPCWAIIVGVRINGQTELSCVYNPLMDETYFAERGKGAFLNGEQIKCSEQSSIIYSLGMTNDSISQNRIDTLSSLMQLIDREKYHNLRQWIESDVPVTKIGLWSSSNGCTGVSCGLLADGRKHWYYCSGGGGPWDYEGTIFLLREAGCIVTNPDGSEWKHGTGPFIAANPTLHKKLVELFTQAERVQDF